MPKQWKVDDVEFEKKLTASLEKIPKYCNDITDSDNSYRFEAKRDIKLTTETKGAKIYYTLDGSEPSENSEVYVEPFEITHDVQIRAIAFAEEHYPSKEFSKWYMKSIFSILKEGYPKISLEEKPTKYGKPDGSQLIDGVFGTSNFTDGKWTGLNEKDLVVELDLGEQIPISEIQVSTLTLTDKWRFPPKGISVFVKGSKGNYNILQKEVYGTISKPDVKINDHNVKFPKQKARYVKVIIENYGTLPQWHKGAGKRPWIFVDEININ